MDSCNEHNEEKLVSVEKRERRKKDVRRITTVKGGEEKKDKETIKEEQTAFSFTDCSIHF